MPRVKGEKKPETINIRDKQNNDTVYPMHYKRALELVQKYPIRFEFENALQEQVANGYKNLPAKIPNSIQPKESE